MVSSSTSHNLGSPRKGISLWDCLNTPVNIAVVSWFGCLNWCEETQSELSITTSSFEVPDYIWVENYSWRVGTHIFIFLCFPFGCGVTISLECLTLWCLFERVSCNLKVWDKGNFPTELLIFRVFHYHNRKEAWTPTYSMSDSLESSLSAFLQRPFFFDL